MNENEEIEFYQEQIIRILKKCRKSKMAKADICLYFRNRKLKRKTRVCALPLSFFLILV